MLISIHIPKTAGSRFLAVLQQAHGSRVAQYYGPDDPRTHPVARRPRSQFDAGMLRDLEGAGVQVLHGHFLASDFVDATPDPARFVVFLREPIERTISHYHFVMKDGSGSNELTRRIVEGGLDVASFASLWNLRRWQSLRIEPFALEDIGFVGITEHFEASLAALGLRGDGRAQNVNRDKPVVPLAARRELAGILTEDVALYSAALERLMRRSRTRDSKARSVYSLLRTAARMTRRR